MFDDRSTWRSSREGFGEALVELGSYLSGVVVLSGDLTESTRAGMFREKFPDRFFQFGVAEQNMMCAAAGMSLVDLVPFVCTYGVFSAGRCWDQLRLSVCYSNCHVIIEGAHAGLLVGPDGASHQATEDIATTRVLPNLTVICPCDAIEAYKATKAAYYIDGPVYIRVGREPIPVVTKYNTPFEIGKSIAFGDGTDVLIVTCGAELFQSLLAQRELRGVGIKVMNCHTIKPLDEDIAIEAKKFGAVVTVEEHQIFGGLGGAVAEAVSNLSPVPIEMVGIRDIFGQSGQPMDLIEHYNLGKNAIIQAVERVMERK
jgi:transketolase